MKRILLAVVFVFFFNSPAQSQTDYKIYESVTTSFYSASSRFSISAIVPINTLQMMELVKEKIWEILLA